MVIVGGRVMSVEALKEAWKDFSLDGATVSVSCDVFDGTEVPIAGWRCDGGQAAYILPGPVFDEDVAERMKQDYAKFRRLHPV